MGLDMYLEIRKNEYRSKYYKDKGCKMKLEYPKDITEFIPNPADSLSSSSRLHNSFVLKFSNQPDLE